MRLFCKNTAGGLVPIYDSDYEEKRKLKLGKEYMVEIREARNLKFHRLYFALINCAWEYQNEKIRAFFHNSREVFRKTVEVQAGCCEKVYNLNLKAWIEVPKSISFGAMSADEFNDLYERVKDVLWSVFLRNVSKEDFENNLINF